jgi:hypothetical protein
VLKPLVLSLEHLDGGLHFRFLHLADSLQILLAARDMRRYEYEQIRLLYLVPLELEQTAEQRQITQQWNLLFDGRLVIANKTADDDGRTTV